LPDCQRYGRRERTLQAGDVVLFRRAPAGAHAVSNRGDAAARVLIVSTMIHPEIGEYPDSGKILVAAGAPPTRGKDAPLELLSRNDSAVGYWDAEPTNANE
jgi:uncharacterized cupin superfamily protein